MEDKMLRAKSIVLKVVLFKVKTLNAKIYSCLNPECFSTFRTTLQQ